MVGRIYSFIINSNIRCELGSAKERYTGTSQDITVYWAIVEQGTIDPIAFFEKKIKFNKWHG